MTASWTSCNCNPQWEAEITRAEGEAGRSGQTSVPQIQKIGWPRPSDHTCRSVRRSRGRPGGARSPPPADPDDVDLIRDRAASHGAGRDRPRSKSPVLWNGQPMTELGADPRLAALLTVLLLTYCRVQACLACAAGPVRAAAARASADRRGNVADAAAGRRWRGPRRSRPWRSLACLRAPRW